jgi:pyruvate ferredoxin oxidoreductase gamma subunit
MSKDYKLAFADDLGFCNILLSAIGGDGANMAAKMLFKLGVLEVGLDGGYDARYGSEKKGTPTDVSVRFCKAGTVVRAVGPTTRPHILVVFHESLIRPLGLNKGLYPDAIVIVNSTKSPEEVRDILELHSGRVICLDASKIAEETRSRLNMPMLAMLCNVLSFPAEVVEEAVKKQWPRAAQANVAAFRAAVSTAKEAQFGADGKYPLVEFSESRGRLGYLNMLPGGRIDALKHSTVGRDNAEGRLGPNPIFDAEECTSCGMCLTVCPDPGAIVWKEKKMTGIDSKFCKSCMRCVEICPRTGRALRDPLKKEDEKQPVAVAKKK